MELGHANKCVPADQARERVIEIATNTPLALRAIKATPRLDLGDKAREITQREAAEQLRLPSTGGTREPCRLPANAVLTTSSAADRSLQPSSEPLAA